MFSSDAEGLVNDVETEALPTPVGNVDEQFDVPEILVSFLCICDDEAISDASLDVLAMGCVFAANFFSLSRILCAALPALI